MKIKMIISIVLLTMFTGCTDTYKMRWAKAEQVCHDNNTIAYKFMMTVKGTRVYCKNGFIKDFTHEQFREIVGLEVEKGIDNFWKTN